jgi:ribosomal protein S18 acetylase RimI-like enzyme
MMMLRDELRTDDAERVRAIVASTGFFSREEEDIAVELVDAALRDGERSGYHLLFLDDGAQTLAYSCCGPIPATDDSWDLYWIAVQADARGRGLGRTVLRATEERIAARGGVRVWIDTSSRPQYAPTRAFYEGCGYHVAAELNDFYRTGDGKVIYCRVLSSPSSAAASSASAR